VFVDGTKVTSLVRETHGAFVLRDLALALVDLARRPRAKAAVRFYDEPWEMCVERFGSVASVSVYRTGADPQVSVYDRAVPFGDVVDAVLGAIDRMLAPDHQHADDLDVDGRGGAGRQLASAAEELRGIDPAHRLLNVRLPEPVPVVVETDRDAPVSFGAEFTMRDAESVPESVDAERERVERADLHALLFPGRVRAEVRGHPVDLGECHPLIVAERLVEIARRAFDAWERGLALHTRGEIAGVLLGVRLNTGGDLALTLGAVSSGVGPRAVHTFPALGVPDFLQAALSFGRSLVRVILRHDRRQAHNLRLGPFRRALRQATDALREASETDSKVNPTPEPYRAFVAVLDGARTRASLSPPAARLRFSARWRAIVPGIDLRATYLCGDRLVVGSATEMWALDRGSGRVQWRADVIRGTSLVTPSGIARLAPDGSMCLYDLNTGEATLRTCVAPRIGGPLAGAVVHLPGLPRLVIVTEGEHHLVAVDLATGEPRWRFSWAGRRAHSRRGRLPGAPRMKRSGRLVYLTCGDGSLTALDVMTGSVVWRLRDRLRFRSPPSVTPDALFVVAGASHGAGRLYSVDPYSGRARWSREIAPAGFPCTIEGAPLVSRRAVAVAIRQKKGLELVAFERDAGTSIDSPARVIVPSGTSWLAVDDAFVGNTPTGELVAVDASSAELLWRQVLGPCPIEADVPRRLEPVLRCGALFVPHAEVVVVRPRDGAVLGAISPTEVIPDLLRVDERCDVYIAEESGHLIAFGAGPRLTLVS
jgi:outer membrane protein assembly factor BamB